MDAESERSWREFALPEDTPDSARNLFVLANGRLLACQRDRRAAWTIAPRTGAAMHSASLPYHFSEGTVVPFRREGGALSLTQKSAELWQPAGKAAGSFISTKQVVRGQCCNNGSQLSDGRVLMEETAPLGGMVCQGRTNAKTSIAGTKQARVEEAAIGLADRASVGRRRRGPGKALRLSMPAMPADPVLSSTRSVGSGDR